jgi:RNA polymerase sigma factor (sigma-70 family)
MIVATTPRHYRTLFDNSLGDSERAAIVESLDHVLRAAVTKQLATYSHLRPHRDDILQDVRLALWQASDKYERRKSQPATWATHVANRVVLRWASNQRDDHKTAGLTDAESLTTGIDGDAIPDPNSSGVESGDDAGDAGEHGGDGGDEEAVELARLLGEDDFTRRLRDADPYFSALHRAVQVALLEPYVRRKSATVQSILRYAMEERSAEEIAAELGCTVKTVRLIVSRTIADWNKCGAGGDRKRAERSERPHLFSMYERKDV